MFADQVLLVYVFSQLYYPLYYLTHAKIQQLRVSVSNQIYNIDLTQHFSLSILTDFRYQSIKTT